MTDIVESPSVEQLKVSLRKLLVVGCTAIPSLAAASNRRFVSSRSAAPRSSARLEQSSQRYSAPV